LFSVTRDYACFVTVQLFFKLQAADGNEPDSYCLSEYFEPIVQKLLETTDRPDAAQANLRAAAYEALMEMVKNSPRDCYITVQKTTMVILERLQQVCCFNLILILLSIFN